MSAPTTPFTTNGLVTYLLQNTFFGGVASAVTVPNDSVLSQLITWTDSIILQSFQTVGYEIPFDELSGETWPTNQTTFLQFLSSCGTAAWISGYVLNPVPTRTSSQASGETNVWAVVFNRIKNDILKNGLRFRAAYYPGTLAEKIIADPYGPRMDYLEDWIDPTRNQLLKDYTDMIMNEYEDIGEMIIDLDYLYRLRETTEA